MTVSATLCAASASMAADPVKKPATNFSTAMPAFAPIATSTVSVLSPPPVAESPSGSLLSATRRG